MSSESNLVEKINLSTVIDDLPVGLVLIDKEGIIRTVNGAFQNSVVGNREKISGRPINSILTDSDKQKFNVFRQECIEGNNALRKQDFKIISYTKRRLKISIYNYLIAEKDLVFLGSISNPDSIKQLGNELKRQLSLKDHLKDELEQESELSEMKSRFLSIASHEFRTPLAGILSSLNLIDRYIQADPVAWSNFKNSVKVVNHINKIKESVKNLTTIIKKFLALGNIEKGEIPVKLSEIDLPRLLETQVSQFKAICKSGQKLTYFHEGREKMVLLDEYLLRNIMNNMLSNAIKFSPEHSMIELKSIIDNDSIRLVISDQGIGIPDDEQKMIFSRFYRAKNALHYGEGTGLGLNIVKKYVELMKGSINFKSEIKLGTTFYITFPKTVM